MQPVTRPADPSDLNFILNSFLKSMRSYPAYQHVPNEVYYSEQKKVLEQLIMSARPKILCNSEEPDQIFGYIIAQPDVETHFIYVKYPFRHMNFAQRLLEETHPNLYTKQIKASYVCRNWEKVAKKFNHIHNPFRG
jgi:hypothetical protein